MLAGGGSQNRGQDAGVAELFPIDAPPINLTGEGKRDMSRDTCQDGKHGKIGSGSNARIVGFEKGKTRSRRSHCESNVWTGTRLHSSFR